MNYHECTTPKADSPCSGCRLVFYDDLQDKIFELKAMLQSIPLKDNQSHLPRRKSEALDWAHLPRQSYLEFAISELRNIK